MEIHFSRNMPLSSSSRYPHRWLWELKSPIIVLFRFILNKSGGIVNFAGGGLWIYVTVTFSHVVAISSVPARTVPLTLYGTVSFLTSVFWMIDFIDHRIAIHIYLTGIFISVCSQ